MTSTMREQIRAATRFARMRLGQDAPEMVTLPSAPDVRVAIVPLTEAEAQAGLIRSANLEVPDNVAGINARNREACLMDVWHATRLPDNIDEHVWPTVEDLASELPSSDIDYLFDSLTTLSDYASPNFMSLDEKEIDDLKKAFAAIDWKELTGRQASALALAVSRLLPELLAVRYSSTGSTSSLTSKSESEIST